MWLSLSTSFHRVATCVFVSCVFGYGVVLPWGGEMPGAQVIQYAQACKWAAITSVVIAQASLRCAHSCSRFATKCLAGGRITALVRRQAAAFVLQTRASR